MDFSLSLSKIDARIRKLENWKAVLAEMIEDAEGRETLREVAAGLNGRISMVPREQRRLPIPPSIQTKGARLDAAIVEVADGMGRPFSSREVMEALSERDFPFSRENRMTEIGAAMRRLRKANKVRVVREKEGFLGRLYERVLQEDQKPPEGDSTT